MALQIKIKDPVSGISHLLGAILSIIGTAFLVYSAFQKGQPFHIFAFFIFGFSMIFLYSSSAIYHLFGHSPEDVDIFRKIDHAMIYILIAGTYTPICLIPLKGLTGFISIIVIWTLAILGVSTVFFKKFWTKVPRWAYTGLYILMGWLSVGLIYPLSKHVPMGFIWLLIIGGLFYTVGAIIYSRKKPNITKGFGFHEIFHILVLLGTASHFFAIYRYLA
ncbi:MAG: hemolysin III family protein [Candidatus Pacebacteria bacterium]|nr:hemolysin III family protein [Candidatus Paceibacterota bacterium]